ncbi:HAD family hydrolase [Neobacillus cucumis]|uniref:Hydrolase n=1 Tax=Neobacillus cucumis TaxID=1740721 RepID=A0A2N5H7D6_9BACI|nr:HAD family hydrolase [Neobacillus cucumis]PLS01424.1 hydrolase [Neobacillus cucumis]
MKALFFDLDDTLYDQLQPFQGAYHSVFSRITDLSILDLFKKSREYSDKVFALTESGEMSLEKMHQYRMMNAFKDFGYTISADEADAFQQEYKNQQYKVSLIPEMKNILQYASTKCIPIFVTTNGPSTHQRQKLESLGISEWVPANHIFISSEVGYAKPHKAFFEHVNVKTKTNSIDSCMVGDSFENDIFGAHQAGWSSIWINTTKKAKPIENVHPTYETNSYQQLENLIKSLV